MAFTNDDRNWLDEKFSQINDKADEKAQELHGRITDAKEELTTLIYGVQEELRVHKNTPCRDVAKHVEDKHDTAKQVGIVASLTAIAGAIGGFIMWLFGKHSN